MAGRLSSPHSAPSPAWPVRYKYSQLSASAVLPSCITKGLQMGATSRGVCHTNLLGLYPPSPSPPAYADLGCLGFCFRPEGGRLPGTSGYLALSHSGTGRLCSVRGFTGLPRPFSFQGCPEPDMLTTTYLSWGLNRDVSRFTIHRNCLG